MEESYMSLLYPEDIDQRLNWPLGRAERLARQRRLPFVLLPDGSIRFRWEEIEELIQDVLTVDTTVGGQNDPY
jgi:hypothetical protein